MNTNIMSEPVAVPWKSVVAAIIAVHDEARRRGSMFPQTSDERADDRAAVHRVNEMIEWYATKGGCVAERLDAWPKLASPPPAPPPTPQGGEKDWTEADLWAELYRLRAAVKGPEGYDSWQDAATAERIRRVKAEAAQPKREPQPMLTDAQIDAAWSALGSFTERRADNRLFARAIERLVLERKT